MEDTFGRPPYTPQAIAPQRVFPVLFYSLEVGYGKPEETK
jgi:hypothetical protein